MQVRTKHIDDLLEQFVEDGGKQVRHRDYRSLIPKGLDSAVSKLCKLWPYITHAVARTHAGQVVLFGAGMDARALRLKEKLPGIVWFEIDHPASQAAKRETLAVRSVRNS